MEVVENYKHKQNIKGVSELQTNIAYSVIMCAIHYKRYSKKFKLPQIDDRTGQAQIWKKYYNTMHGKGTIEKAVSKSALRLPNAPLPLSVKLLNNSFICD